MKTQIALIGLMAIPCFAFADGKPAGVLGVNNVYGYGIYENSHYTDGSDADYSGLGIGVNQSLIKSEKFGLDAGFNYEYWTDQGSTAESYYKSNDYTLSATAYSNLGTGKFSPFLTGMFYFDNSSYTGASNVGSRWVAAKLGVEIHVQDGWYVTPSMTFWQRVHSDDPSASACVDFSMETGYWITDRVGVYANLNYREMNLTEQTWSNFGIRVRY